jgi:hypothetical protein
MSKHTFQIGNKLGGNKPKPYKTKQIRKHVPEDIFNEVIDNINDTIKQWKLLSGHKKSKSLKALKMLKGLQKS